MLDVLDMIIAVSGDILLLEFFRLLYLLYRKKPVRKEFIFFMSVMTIAAVLWDLETPLAYDGMTSLYMLMQGLFGVSLMTAFGILIAFVYKTIANRHAEDKNRKELRIPFIVSLICVVVFAELAVSMETPEYQAYEAEQRAAGR